MGYVTCNSETEYFNIYMVGKCECTEEKRKSFRESLQVWMITYRYRFESINKMGPTREEFSRKDSEESYTDD